MRSLQWAGLILFSMVSTGVAQTADQRADMDVAFCLDSNANHVPGQSFTRGVCWQVPALSAILANAGQAKLASAFLTMKQYELGRAAVPLACQKTSPTDAAAAALIMACQCHNISGYNFARDEQGKINAALRRRGNC